MQAVKPIPSSGGMEDLFQRLREYIIQFDPAWENRVCGASDQDVRQLTKLSGLTALGLKYPKSYRLYLRHMGKSDGGLIGLPLRHCSVTWLSERYEESKDAEPDELSPEAPIAACFVSGDLLSFDFRSPLRSEPELYVTADSEFFEFYAECWEKLLFQQAVWKYERCRLPITQSFGSSESSLAEALSRQPGLDPDKIVRRFAAKERLSLAWFNDRANLFAFRNDVSVHVSLIGGTSAVIVAYGTETDAVLRLGNDLALSLGACLTSST